MKPDFSLLVFGVTLCVLVTMAAAKEPINLTQAETAALEHVTQGTNKFAVSLYRALLSKHNKGGNMFVSPLSVQMVLALAYTGAKDSTASELAKLLGLPDKLEETYLGYNSLIRILQDPVLKLANRMFVEASAPLKQEFQGNAKKHFLAPAESVEFSKNAEKSRTHINNWVEEQTNKKITNLLAPGTIASDTRLVLVNAIHFKADWKQKFLEEKTKKEPFHVSKTKTVDVDMMHTKKKFGFKHDDELKAKMLELDYQGGNFRMIIILPDEIEGLADLEAKLEKVDLSEKLRYFEVPEVTVALPKFKLEETMELNDILKSLGAESMFSSKANFQGLSSEPLAVSKVVQKAFVEVNEKGTEAAAATAACVRKKRAVEYTEPREFIADHPFVFVLSEKPTNLVVFVGRFCFPSLPHDKARDEL